MGLGGLVKSITKPISSAVKSISDIPGSVNNFVKNPVDSLGTGIGNFYMAPGRALGSDSLTNLGGAFGAATGGMLLGPNGGKAAGEASGTSSLGQAFGRGTVGTIAALSALYGLGAMGGGAAGAKAGAGTTGFTSGQGLMGSGGVSSLTSAPAYAGTGASGGGSFLGSLGSGAMGAGSKIGNFLTSTPGILTGLGLTDLALRYKQGEDLEKLAREAAERADAFNQPQRFPYQNLLSGYLQDGQSIAEQPYVKANMDFALQKAVAEMARTGRSGAGGSGRELVDYASNVFESNALPYLNQLSGMAGFGFGPGASGQLYGQYGSMATGAPFQGLDSLARAIGSSQPSVAPWQLAAFNAQQQMQGMGPGRNFTLS